MNRIGIDCFQTLIKSLVFLLTILFMYSLILKAESGAVYRYLVDDFVTMPQSNFSQRIYLVRVSAVDPATLTPL